MNLVLGLVEGDIRIWVELYKKYSGKKIFICVLIFRVLLNEIVFNRENSLEKLRVVGQCIENGDKLNVANCGRVFVDLEGTSSDSKVKEVDQAQLLLPSASRKLRADQERVFCDQLEPSLRHGEVVADENLVEEVDGFIVAVEVRIMEDDGVITVDVAGVDFVLVGVE